MLLNISNHPSAAWPEAQRNAAKERFGTTQDIPHPEVDPEADSEAILYLARYYLDKVLEHHTPLTVHLMGEQSFCYTLTHLLQQQDIPVVCSTTRRIAETLDDGTIRRGFAFIQFREYPLLHNP